MMLELLFRSSAGPSAYRSVVIRTTGWRVWLLILLLTGGGFSLQAQWLTQTNVIKPGWTAVYFYVDASGQSLDSLVGFNPACPIDQIWLWKTPASPAEYISDPAVPLAGNSQWLNYYRPASGMSSSLTAIIPNAAYLVHNSASTNYTWRVQGQPVPPSYVWDNTGLNFIGFSTPYASPPSFQAFLAQAPLLASGVQLFTYAGGPFSAQNPAQILSQYTTPVTRGAAFWVSNTNINNTYFGPFTVTLPNPIGLNYGSGGGQQTLHLLNVTSNALVVSVHLLPSETPTYVPTNIAGVPPLLVEGALDSTNLTYGYTALSGNNSARTTNAFSWTLAPGGQPGSDVQVVLGVDQFSLGSPGSFYAGILQFTDSLGFSEVDVPVSASSASTAGLWVGATTISQVGSYLKTYATGVSTNAAGLLTTNILSTAVTNQVVATNAIALLVTNVIINNFVSSNETVTYYNLTNLMVNTYATNRLTIATNSYVVATNLVIDTFALTNLVITSTVTNYYFDAGEIIWQMANVTNQTGVAYALTNVMLTTNLLVSTVVNNTAEPVTYFQLNDETVTNLVVTNGPFMNPVTNLTLSFLTTTNYGAATNLAFNVLSTNSLWLSTTTNFGVFTNYSVTSLAFGAYSTTNYVVTNTALYAVTNGMLATVVTPLINNYSAINQYNQVFDTNAYAVSNNFVLLNGATNYLGSTTNLLVAISVPVPGSPHGTNYAVTTLTEAVQPAYVVVTNLLMSANSNYVVTATTTSLGAVPASAPMTLRLILFNDGTNSSLLQRVYVGFSAGTNEVVSTTESALDPTQLGTARRISAPEFPWTAANTPFPLSAAIGKFGAGGTLVTSPAIFEPYDDQAGNPFLHTYHPDHNNLDYTFNPPHELPRGSQSYDISQAITLQFEAGTSDFIGRTTASSSLSGIYMEAITLTGQGGASRTFNTQGNFNFVRVSNIATLTTQ